MLDADDQKNLQPLKADKMSRRDNAVSLKKE
jgi:hypothetical protein